MKDSTLYIRPAIVIAAYNRPHSLSRLLSMVLAADYPDDTGVPLVISIDGGGSEEVVRVANEFKWPFGDKEVIVHSKNLGLRQHILSCGDLTEKYGAIIMLEDDLGVSKFFYQYTLQALDQFSSDDEIAGVSLYKHLINVNCGSSFEPMDNGLGYYYMQFPQSWGQAWTSRQWTGFRQWYEVETNRSKPLDLPKYVDRWPESSWLKYFTRYLIDQGKCFVYPMKSLTTNFSDTGTHVCRQDNTYQVPLAEYCPSLRDVETSQVVYYDAYFEMSESTLRMFTQEFPSSSIIVDLYGIRDLSVCDADQLLLTVRPCSESVRSYGLRLKPREINVELNVPGDKIFLTKRKHLVNMSALEAIEREFSYDKKWLGLKTMIRLLLHVGINRVLGR